MLEFKESALYLSHVAVGGSSKTLVLLCRLEATWCRL